METQTNRILLADDNIALRTVLLSALSDEYDVHAVGDGRELADELQAHPYDLVITDLNLPHCTGSAALRRTDRFLTGLGRLKTLDVPVLIITGMDDEDDEVRIARRMPNVKGVFFKPLDLQALRAQIGSTLNEPADAEPETGLELLQSFVRDMSQVLVVDDEPEIRDLLSLSFEPAGIQIRTCATVESALRLCRKYRFDLILLDFRLEAETAEDLLAQLYEQLGAERMPPVLLVSGYGDSLAMERFRRFPAVQGIVSKPFDVAQLLDFIQHRFLRKATPPADPEEAACAQPARSEVS